MPLPAKVLPGDLILADWFNQLIDFMAAEDVRITALENAAPGSTAAVTIFGTLPVAPVQTGSTLKIIGKGFGLSSAVTVYFDAYQAAVQPGSGDALLVVTVPNVPATTDGQQVTIHVNAQAGSATYPMFVIPPPVLTNGRLVMTLSNPTLPAGQVYASPSPAGAPYDFPFSIDALTNQDDTYLLTASAGPDASPWPTSIVADDGSSMAVIPIPKTSGTTIKGHLKVTIPGSQTGSFQVSLGISCKGNPAFQNVPVTPLSGTIGQAPGDNPPINTSYTATDASNNPITPDPKTGLLSFPHDQVINIAVLAMLPAKTDTYNVTVGLAPNAAPLWAWSPQTLQFSNQGNYPIPLQVKGSAGALDTTLTLEVRSTTANTQYGRCIVPLHVT
ncbi:MAG TPA: IPT/TIG domain-containing protein [Anaeromyxobacter sp.]|nr:IPT/TIG domain-containing protein [Anaeromyxobacter sp.]